MGQEAVCDTKDRLIVLVGTIVCSIFTKEVAIIQTQYQPRRHYGLPELQPLDRTSFSVNTTNTILSTRRWLNSLRVIMIRRPEPLLLSFNHVLAAKLSGRCRRRIVMMMVRSSSGSLTRNSLIPDHVEREIRQCSTAKDQNEREDLKSRVSMKETTVLLVGQLTIAL